MERLTFRMGNDCITVAGVPTYYNPTRSRARSMTRAVARLAAYEDIGLMPWEIKALITERDAAVAELKRLKGPQP